ncbi:MAG: Mur ligase family protein [Deltaproteobacteria bacterium]|nr:Mur ligase family protein [Deltaproteobacteria bacterium]
MDYQQALGRLYGLSSRGMRLGLGPVSEAAARLGNPERALRCVQIAGTNGKGTVSCLLAHAAREAGLTVGLFTSPHLHRFAERIRVNGDEADEATLARHITRVFDVMEDAPALPLTFFEIATLAALSAFAEAAVDLAVLEVGLGGRLDATTIAPAEATAIVTIGLDHPDLLGSTVAEVAHEKAGIARPGVPIVVGPLAPQALTVVDAHARMVGAPVLAMGRDFFVPEDLTPPWPGRHQRENAAVALKVFAVLGRADARLAPSVFARALPEARWPGRYEIVDGRPRHILDGAHNAEGAAALAQTLVGQGERPDAAVFGAVRGKPVSRMLDILRPVVGRVVLTRPPLSRALDPAGLFAPGDEIVATVEGALARAAALAGPRGTVLVTGSLFTMAEARRLLLGERSDPPVGL